MAKNVNNLLISLKNNASANLSSTCTEYTIKKIKVLDILYKHGYVQSYSLNKSTFKIYITLRYLYNKSTINNLKFFAETINSKNLSLKSISKISNKNSTLFISTSKGIYTSLECKKKKIGGKAFFFF